MPQRVATRSREKKDGDERQALITRWDTREIGLSGNNSVRMHELARNVEGVREYRFFCSVDSVLAPNVESANVFVGSLPERTNGAPARNVLSDLIQIQWISLKAGTSDRAQPAPPAPDRQRPRG